MASNTREVMEGKQYQGADEIIAYTLDVSAIGSTPSAVAVVVKDKADGSAVTSTVMPTGSPSVAGNIITLPPLKLLTADALYKIEVKYVIAGNTLETYFHVQCQE